MFPRQLSGLILLTLLIRPLASDAADPSPFEVPRVWPATAFIPPANVPGDGWRIDPTVANDGIYNTWDVTSKIGAFQITGNERLLELIREIEATIQLSACVQKNGSLLLLLWLD